MTIFSLLKNVSASSLLLTLLIGAGAAQASVVVGSIDKNYGSAAGRTGASNSGAGSCDTLNATSITVRDTTSGCGRFADVFDFSSLKASSIDSFRLTLNFSGTNDLFMFVFREDWNVRPASGSTGSTDLFDMTNSSSATTQSFMFDNSNLDLFGSIVAGGKFSLWFADEALGANHFNLSSARLEVLGTAAVPEPGSIALLGLGLAGLAAVRKRKQA